MELTLDRRSCDSCEAEECIDCGATHGRRTTDTCSDHEWMTQGKKESENFRLQMKTGIAVTSFFLLVFVAWIASSIYTNAEELTNRQAKYEVKSTEIQKTHEQTVSESMLEMEEHVAEVAKIAGQIKMDVQGLIKTFQIQQKLNEKRLDKLEEH